MALKEKKNRKILQTCVNRCRAQVLNSKLTNNPMCWTKVYRRSQQKKNGAKARQNLSFKSNAYTPFLEFGHLRRTIDKLNQFFMYLVFINEMRASYLCDSARVRFAHFFALNEMLCFFYIQLLNDRGEFIQS